MATVSPALLPGRCLRALKSVRHTAWMTGSGQGGRSVAVRATAKRSRVGGVFVKRFPPILVGVLLLDLAIGTWRFDDRTPAGGRFDSMPAAGYDRARAAQVQDDGEAARFVEREGLWVVSQVSSETVNVDVTGSRRTVGNRSGGLRVGFVGGSAAFGLGQGDDRTIASEMARMLNSGDAPVEVVNLGTPAWTLFDSARDLEARIAKGERFDVVVAYSGANEIFMGVFGLKPPVSMVEVTVYEIGRPSDSFFEHWADRSILARLAGREPRPARTPLRVTDSSIETLMADARSQMRRGTPAENLERTNLIEFNYAEGSRVLDALAAANGFSVLYVLQPLKDDATGRTKELRAPLAKGASDPLDLVGIAPTGCFYDAVHTAESCSKDIAAAIVAEFRSRGLDTRSR